MSKFDDIIREKLSNVEGVYDASAWNAVADQMFDDIISEKLSNVEGPNDPNAWNKVARGLDGRPVDNSFRPALIGGIAATIALGTLFTSLPDIRSNSLPAETPASDHPAMVIGGVEGDQAQPANFPTEHEPQEVHEITFTSQQWLKDDEKDNKTTLKPNSTDPVSNTKTRPIEEAPEVAVSNVQQTPINATTPVEHPIDYTAKGIQCPGQPITFEAKAHERDAQIEWLFDGIHFAQGAAVDFAFEEAGEHKIVAWVEGADGSVTKLERTIEIFAEPVAEFSFETQENRGCFGQQLLLTARPSENTYKWMLNGDSIGKGAQLSAIASAGNHNIGLQTINAQGCISTQTHFISVDPGLMILPPTAFTPNSDGKNDTWLPVGLERVQSFTLEIKRLQDNMTVYKTTEVEAWDGSINNTAERARAGENFVWTLSVTDRCGTVKQETGSIQVVDF